MSRSHPMRSGGRYEVRLLGSPTLLDAGAPVALRHQKGYALVYRAASNPGPLDRGVLADLLWTDHDETRARNNLRVVLAEINRLAPGLLDATRHAVGLAQDVTVDRHLLFDAWREGSTAPLPEALLEPFLDGFALRNESAFDAWLVAERESWRATLLGSIDQAVERAVSEKAVTTAVTLLQQALTLDYWEEARHARLLELLVEEGRHAAAVQHYDRFARAVRKDMGIDPDPALAQVVQAARREPATVHASLLEVQEGTRYGQEAALRDLVDLLEAPDVRLVTVQGPPGSGASRLLRDALREAHVAFRDGESEPSRYLVSLEGASSGPEAWHRVADAMALHPSQGAVTLVHDIVEHLGDASTLLLLDDLHGALDLVEGVDTLLRECGRLRIVVTGHASIGWVDERVVRIPLLALPPEGRTAAPIDALRASPAVQLLSEVVARRGTRIDVTEETAAWFESVTRWTHGHPLAIVLAGHALAPTAPNRSDVYEHTPVQRLDEGPHGLPDRHRSLAAALRTAFTGIREGQRALLKAMTVLRAPATLEAIAALQAREEGLTGRLVEDALRRGSIRTVTGPQGEKRYALHPIYAWAVEAMDDQLDASREAEYRANHAAYFLQRARRAADQSEAHYRARLLSSVAWDMEDVDAALDDLAERDPVEATRTAVALAPLHRRFGRSEGALTRLMELEARVAQRLDDALRGDVLNALGTFAFLADRRAEAKDYLEEALALRRLDGRPEKVAVTLMNLATLEALGGGFDEALARLDDALDLVNEKAHASTRAGILLNVANVLTAAGREAEALKPYEQATRKYQEIGDFEGALGSVLGWIGVGAQIEGSNEVLRAYQVLRYLLEVMQEGADPRIAGSFRLALIRVRDAGLTAYERDLKELYAYAVKTFGWPSEAA